MNRAALYAPRIMTTNQPTRQRQALCLTAAKENDMKKKHLIDTIMKVNPEFDNDVQEQALWLLGKRDLELGLRVEVDILARNRTDDTDSVAPDHIDIADEGDAGSDAETRRALYDLIQTRIL